jgi:hypothetical protein
MNKMTEQILEHLRGLVISHNLPIELLPELARIIETDTDEWINSTAEQLQELVTDWENVMGSSDSTYYSLGLRRAIDVVTGEDSIKRLPILETPDTKIN